MRNFIVLCMILLQSSMANRAQSSTIDLEDNCRLEHTTKNYQSVCYDTITPAVNSLIIVTDDDETEEQLTQDRTPWYQRPYSWVRGVYKIRSLVQSDDTNSVTTRFNDQNAIINYEDNFKTKRLKFAVKFWRYADHSTEVAICMCTSVATVFCILPDHNEYTEAWSYTDFGSIFTAAATLLGIVKIGTKYIGSYRAQQLEANQH